MQAKRLAILSASVALVATCAALPAAAQSGEPGRYQLVSVAGGFVRLDTTSGAMTFCRDDVDTVHCGAIAADKAKAMDPKAGVEPRAGQEENRDDRAGIDRPERGENPDIAGRAGEDGGFAIRPEPGFKQRGSLEDFDHALSMMERAMKGFMAMSRENQRDCAL
jgi:hypothetical protein